MKEKIMLKNKINNNNHAKPEKSAVHLSHPHKILYPGSGITKLDLANYYEHIADWILPYVVNRPLTLVRCPDNFKDCFYQKHLNNAIPDNLYSVDDIIYIKNLSGLLSLVQMDTLEIHLWECTIKNMKQPDYITFDLDPAPDVKWQRLVETAFNIKKHLQEINLNSFIKTTGGKGLHIVVPIKPMHDWKTIKHFAHTFVKVMAVNYPDYYVTQMSKAKRKGKIFLDYLRNQKGATSVAPYSTRARKSAPVSTPIAWDELTNSQEDTMYTLLTLPNRLKKLRKDPWKDFLTIKQVLKI